MGLGALLHTSLFSSAALIQAAAAVAIALSAGAFVSYSLRRGVWELAVVALVVGTSAALVRLMGGTYTDNLIAEALFAAALVPALSSVRDGRGFAAAVLLIAIGHWMQCRSSRSQRIEWRFHRGLSETRLAFGW